VIITKEIFNRSTSQVQEYLNLNIANLDKINGMPQNVRYFLITKFNIDFMGSLKEIISTKNPETGVFSSHQHSYENGRFH